jgi:DNA-binding XRE family transcriptional regulator
MKSNYDFSKGKRNPYAKVALKDDSVDIFETDWYKEAEKEMTIGDTIRGYRELMGLTQAQLGEKLGGQSRHYVSDLERDRRSPSKEVAKKLSKIFSISTDNFL